MKEEGKPDFPYFWIEKPDMSSLRVLADHLKQKSWAFENTYGFRGETNDMEKQIIDQMSIMRQQVAELTDTVEATLQILDNQRISQRAKRGWKSIQQKVGIYWHRVFDSKLFKICGGVTTVASVITLLNHFLHFRK
jgi:hypothetical protein